MRYVYNCDKTGLPLSPKSPNVVSEVSAKDPSCKTGNTMQFLHLSPLEEFLLVTVRLRLGLLKVIWEIVLVFPCLQLVSHICTTWINFLYVMLKEIPMWPKRETIQSDHACQFASSSFI